jgi:hypothetical protein
MRRCERFCERCTSDTPCGTSTRRISGTSSTTSTGEDLDWFFDQWLHTTDQLDYAIGSTSTARTADGAWLTSVEVRRAGEAWMPITLRVGDVEQRLTSREPVQIVEVTTPARPDEVVLDPEMVLLDLDRSNNRRAVPAG